MPLTKAEKQEILTTLKEKVAKQKAIVFADFKGMGVKDMTKLRREMSKNNCELKVAKKTLIAAVLKENKIEVNIKKLEGEIVLGFGYQDEVLPFKLLYEFSKGNEKLKIRGGLMGLEVVDGAKAIALGQLPTRDELLTRLMVNALQGSLRKFIYALSQIKGQV